MRVDPNYVFNLTTAVSSSAATEQKLTNQLASGLRVSTLSDDPVAASSNVLLAQSIAKIDAFVQSSSRQQSLLQVTDSTLGEVVSQVTSALSLAVSSTNGTLNGANRAALAQQVADLRDSVISLANTSYQGAYLFSGSQGTTQPFVLDQTTSPAAVSYHGDQVTNTITTPEGLAVKTNVPGSAIFTATGVDLLGTLNQLVADVGSGDATALSTDTANLTAALGNLSTQRSAVGSSLARLTANTSYEQTQQTVLKSQQSSLLSADPATVATDLKSAEVEHQALLAVISQLGSTNLFNYLK